MNAIKYVHTNLIARDWRKLADFYITVFNCTPLDPERDLSGDWVDSFTGLANAHIRGVHLALPGWQDGPTLEIFQYEPEAQGNGLSAINSYGLGHLAFHVDNVEKVLEMLLVRGGSQIGQLVQKQYPELGLLTAVYARDPEGNIIEIQNWSK
ncbi:MAG TPA: VOC family protein [Syntrophomonadaceae bacterium]|nr:VOC family protein [Syntrophomonadaceae bacterium]